MSDYDQELWAEDGTRSGTQFRTAIVEFICNIRDQLREEFAPRLAQREPESENAHAEIIRLRVQLNLARKDLQQLKARAAKQKEPPAPVITSWLVDRTTYRVTPFSGSKPGVTLDLRGLFEQYQHEAS